MEAGNVHWFAKAVEEVLEMEKREPGSMEKKGMMASEFIRANYSPEREAKVIVEIWEKILAKADKVRWSVGSLHGMSPETFWVAQDDTIII